MKKTDRTLLLGGIAFAIAVFLHLLCKEFPATTLALFISTSILYIHYFIGGLFVLGFLKNENTALHLTILVLAILMVIINGMVYLSLIF